MIKFIDSFNSYIDELIILCEKYVDGYDKESLSNPLFCHLSKEEQEAIQLEEGVDKTNIPELLDFIPNTDDEVKTLGEDDQVANSGEAD